MKAKKLAEITPPVFAYYAPSIVKGLPHLLGSPLMLQQDFISVRPILF